MNQQSKFYKNPSRVKENISEHKPYVPQYQLLGVEPEVYKSATSVPMLAVKSVPKEPLPLDNPRAPKVGMRNVPYADVTDSPIGRGRGPVPNVGNNMEHTWSSVDSEIVDDVSGLNIDQAHHMIDNNEMVSLEALGYQSNKSEDIDIVGYESAKDFLTEKDLNKILDTKKEISAIKSLKDDDYMVVLFDNVVATGTLDKVQAMVTSLIFGENQAYKNVSIDDIHVVKKVKIKVGVFLE